MIHVLRQCERELKGLPEDVRKELGVAVATLEDGRFLRMPVSRPMPVIGRGVHELRLNGESGEYRVIYALMRSGEIWFLHAFQKKSQQTPRLNIEVAKKRLREVV